MKDIWTDEFPTQDGVYRARFVKRPNDPNDIMLLFSFEDTQYGQIMGAPGVYTADDLKQRATKDNVQFHGPLTGPQSMESDNE